MILGTLPMNCRFQVSDSSSHYLFWLSRRNNFFTSDRLELHQGPLEKNSRYGTVWRKTFTSYVNILQKEMPGSVIILIPHKIEFMTSL